ncbi:MAG: isochorismatase family protein [candidate division Zixibacteria bacterium]|nr:isochorismatase family protein [candidate division Zixibacteria bacterium]
MLTADNAVFVLIDIQGKLATLMHNKENLFKNIRTMIEGAKILGIPVIWNEQIPEKLGATSPEIAEKLEGMEPLAKNTFSCCGNGEFMEQLRSTGRKQALIAGIEAHVCVYQTAMDLLREGYEVHLLGDAVSSRFESSYQIGLTRMRDEGAKLTCVEMALFEMLQLAQGDKFKQVIKIVK